MKHSGFILIGTLFFSFILTTLLTLICTRISADIQSRKNEISGFKEFESTKVSYPAKKVTTGEYVQKLLFKEKGTLKLIAMQYQDTGIPDFERFSHTTALCEQETPASLSYTNSGTRLTPSAFVSSHTCKDIIISGEKNIYYLTSNIELEELNPDPRSYDEELILATTGYLAITQMKVGANRVSLFAAGDIFIAALNVPTNALLSLYSSSGVIVLQQVEGTGQIEALAKEGVYAPGTSSINKLKSSNYLRSSYLLGLKELAPDTP